MDKVQANEIFEAIKKDDVNAFVNFVVRKNLQNISFGRFPLLSVCYLFDSMKIIERFEKHLARVGKFEQVFEFYEIYKKFKQKAKKSLRLYLDDDAICYPVEMLAILDRRNRLAKNYELFFKNEQITINLTKIYNLNKKIKVHATAEKFVCAAKKMNSLQKICFAMSLVFVALFAGLSGLFVGIVSNNFGLGTEKLPILIDSKEEFSKALHEGTKCYKLTKDLEIVSNTQITAFSGVFDGGGHEITLESGVSLFQNLAGVFKNVKITAKNNNEKISQNYSIIAENLTGKIENIEIFAKIDAKFEVVSDTYLSAFVISNDGVISNSTLEVEANLKNAEPVNAYFSGFAGMNNGTIQNCKNVSGFVSADTVDIAACAFENTGLIDGFENNVTVYQISGEEWNPNCSGVVGTNVTTIKNVINNAKIEAISTAENQVEDASGNNISIEMYVAGIACQNSGTIERAKNYGEIVSTGKVATVCVGGIAAFNTFKQENSKLILGLITNSKSVANLKATGENAKCMVGGLVAYNLGKVTKSGAESTITSSKDGYSGGLVGRSGVIYYSNSSMIAAAGIVTSCYTNTNFVPFESGANKAEYIFGSLIGFVDIRITMQDNHFVTNSTYNAVIYLGPTLNPYTSASECNATAYDSFEEIPSEVKNNVN